MKSRAYEMCNYEGLLEPTKEICAEVRSRRSSRCRNENFSFRQRQKRKPSTQNKKHINRESNCYANKSNTRNNFDKNSQSKSTLDQCAAKIKSKAAPLSKYRRKTANARERTRMRQINSAFENLRKCVPNAICGDVAGVANEKLTKITTLRLAMKYINVLRETLNNPTYGKEFLLQCISDGDYRFTNNPNLDTCKKFEKAEIHIQSKTHQNKNEKNTPNTSFAAASKKYKTIKISQKPSQKINTKKNSTKCKIKIIQDKDKDHRHHIKSDLTGNDCDSLYSPSSFDPLSSSSLSHASTTSSAHVTLSTSSSPGPTVCYHPEEHTYQQVKKYTYYPYEKYKTSSLNDLNSIFLESDGESMHLSESCLSPFEDNTIRTCKQIPCFCNDDLAKCARVKEITSVYESSQALNLNSLGTHSEPGDLNIENHEVPSLCISPLITLDGLSPFGDLLDGNFTEPSSLDLFL